MHPTWQLKLHERFYSLRRRTVDVHQSLVRAQLELLTLRLVHVCLFQNGIDYFVCRQWNWSTYYSTSCLNRLNDLLSTLINQVVVVRLELYSDLLIHYLV